MAGDFHSCVCLLSGRGGLVFLLGKRENSHAPCRILVRSPICLPSSLIFIFGSRVGLPLISRGALPTCNTLPTSSPPFSCGLRPSRARDQLSLTLEQGWTPPNKDLFIWSLESGHGETGNNWNIIEQHFYSFGSCTRCPRNLHLPSIIMKVSSHLPGEGLVRVLRSGWLLREVQCIGGRMGWGGGGRKC